MIFSKSKPSNFSLYSFVKSLVDNPLPSTLSTFLLISAVTFPSIISLTDSPLRVNAVVCAPVASTLKIILPASSAIAILSESSSAIFGAFVKSL